MLVASIWAWPAKDANYFRGKADGLRKTKLEAGGKYHKQNVATQVSYLVALRIEIAMKPHTIVELLLPVGKATIWIMTADKFVRQLSAFSLSMATASEREMTRWLRWLIR